MDHLLLQRQLGARRCHKDVYTEVLVRRLANTQIVPTYAASSAAVWDDSGTLLACAGEDSTLRLWSCDKGVLTHKLEPVRIRVHYLLQWDDPNSRSSLTLPPGFTGSH